MIQVRHVDLIISDWILPDESGKELLIKVRANESTDRIRHRSFTSTQIATEAAPRGAKVSFFESVSNAQFFEITVFNPGAVPNKVKDKFCDK